MDLPHAIWSKHYLTYKNQIVGFAAPKEQLSHLSRVDKWLATEAPALRAFTAGVSVKLFTQKATTLSGADILALPYPENGTLDLSDNERVLVGDITDYYRDLIRLGEDSKAMKESGFPGLTAFSKSFTRQINSIYKQNPLRTLKPHTWPGVICLPFVFGDGKVDWSGVDELKGKLDTLLHERSGTTLQITRIARIYDGKFIFLLKPNRLRYWLRSVALRDSDEALSDLRAQGF
jgi:hypothetical protein